MLMLLRRRSPVLNGKSLVSRRRGSGSRQIEGPLPGDGVNGVMEAIRKAQKANRVRFIQARHEEAAALMACGYAKFTGKLGCCLATSGPGGIHLLNGLYDAKLDRVPVLAITGLQFHDLLGTFTQQDVALDKLFIDVATYNERVMGAAHIRNVAELAGVIAGPVQRKVVLAVASPDSDPRARTAGGRPH